MRPTLFVWSVLFLPTVVLAWVIRSPGRQSLDSSSQVAIRRTITSNRLANTFPSKTRRRVLVHSSTGSDDASLDGSSKDEGTEGVLVTLKIALDATGGAADLAATKSKRFTCEQSLDMVHRLRASSDAVLIGRSTVVADNPSLTIRRSVPDWDGERQPLRVVIDPTLSLLRNETTRRYHLFTDRSARTVIFHGDDVQVDLTELPSDKSVVCVGVPLEASLDKPRRLSSSAVLKELRDNFGVHHLMVEGGPATAHNFLNAHLIDRCVIVRASPTVKFQQPLDAGLTSEVLEAAGLEYLGTTPSGVDQIDYWSRPGLPWPSPELSAWP